MPGDWGQRHNPANLNFSSDRRYTCVCELAVWSPELAGQARVDSSEGESLEQAKLPTAKQREWSWHLQPPKNKGWGSGGAGGAGGSSSGGSEATFGTRRKQEGGAAGWNREQALALPSGAQQGLKGLLSEQAAREWVSEGMSEAEKSSAVSDREPRQTVKSGAPQAGAPVRITWRFKLWASC